ncbi:MAG TPA: class I SAM-dependent methyltransferase [Bacteroidota bacterium]|nr:class I SAM-dependent methyltransferase [Bacteroidota bacterium]
MRNRKSIKAPTPAMLDLGCGLRKRPGAIGIDVNPRSHADVIHDLNRFPYPFQPNRFNEIIADNVLEHLDDVVRVMEELHRIATPSALVTIVVPFYAHRQANTDPTHRHFFGVHSFDYFIEGTANAGFRYSPARFELVSVEFDRDVDLRHWLDRMVVSFANRRQDFYENRLSNIFPLRNLTFQLRVVK